MDSTTAPDAPAIGALYRKRSTGRNWHVYKICDSGLIGLSEDFHGIHCSVRDIVDRDRLAQDYEALP